MLGPSLHAVINLLDRAVPGPVRQFLKRNHPALVNSIYHELTLRTSDTPVDVRVQGGALGGRQFCCSLRHQRSCYLGNFEPAKEQVLRDFLKPGQVLFDVGGHIGYFSLIAATLVRPAGLVVAFEPAPVNVPQFERNLALNPDLAANVRLEKRAVSDVSGVVAFEHGDNSYIGRLAPGASTSSVEVSSTTLDDYHASSGLTPDFVKIDAEGAEIRIFAGMSRLLTKARPPFMVEIHARDNYDALIGVLDRYRYVARNVEDAGPFTTHPPFAQMVDYLAVPA
jgi:FkbM family methyltransferase